MTETTSKTLADLFLMSLSYNSVYSDCGQDHASAGWEGKQQSGRARLQVHPQQQVLEARVTLTSSGRD